MELFLVILTDNVLYLKKKYPILWERLKALETMPESTWSVELETAKNGDSTLVIQVNGRRMYVHSKYNPTDEAQQFISQYEEMDEYEHVFFYGVGLGYHIDAFCNMYPDKHITLYEPEAQIMFKYLSRKSLNDFSNKQLNSVFVEDNPTQVEQFLTNFVNNLNEKLLLIQLPSYERSFENKFKAFSEIFKRVVSHKISNFEVNSTFEKRWTFNSMLNLPTTLKTPNVQMQKQHYFKGKPAIIVAAGPSLQEEIENLRKIKEEGSAYIFSVGTAINALISNGIKPDAACTFDPSNLNRKVFEKLHLLAISDIPLIYGTTVAYEVLKDYLGPKLHMITSQDKVANFYLRMKDGKQADVVYDAASIAVVTLDLLSKLKCNPIILVGQNLAFKNNKNYAEDANVFRINDVSESEKTNAILVEGVNGDQVQTTKEFNFMREQIEVLTNSITDLEVINTTSGGAKIASTLYMPLKEIMEKKLDNKVVDDNWFAPEEWCYDAQYAIEQAKVLKDEKELLLECFNQATRLFNEIHRAADLRNVKKLGKLFPKFDELFAKKILKNRYFLIFIQPMNGVLFDLLSQKVDKMRLENDYVAKARLIIQEFGKFIYSCHVDALNFEDLFRVIQEEVIPDLQKETTANV